MNQVETTAQTNLSGQEWLVRAIVYSHLLGVICAGVACYWDRHGIFLTPGLILGHYTLAPPSKTIVARLSTLTPNFKKGPGMNELRWMLAGVLLTLASLALAAEPALPVVPAAPKPYDLSRVGDADPARIVVPTN